MKLHQTVVTCIGLNHQTSPVEEREKLAFSPEEMPDALARLGEELGGAVLLSTCNRTEIYAPLPATSFASLRASIQWCSASRRSSGRCATPCPRPRTPAR